VDVLVGLLVVLLKMAELREYMNEVIPTKDISLQKILNNLIEGDKNLDLKTHIFKPKQLASLIVIQEYFKTIGLNTSSDILLSFMKHFKRLMVSYKRLSRIEIIKAISSILEKERLTNTEKMTTKLI